MISPLTIFVVVIYFGWPLLLAIAIWQALPQGFRNFLQLLFWGMMLVILITSC